MTVAVPPQPPPARDTACDASATLIKEANRRSLHRRLIYGGVATVVVAIAAATWAILPSDTSPPHSATRYVSNPPRTLTPLAAPLIEGAGAASNLRDLVDLYPEAAAGAYTVTCGISSVEIAAWRAVGGVDALNRHCANLAQRSTVAPEDREAIFAGIFGGVPTPPAVPLGAPLVVGPDAASTLLTSFGQIHYGYVFVYADGRVISSLDGANGEQQHLSQRGLELVRAGQLTARALGDFLLFGSPAPWVREEGVWAELNPTMYEPSHYAVCFMHPSGPLAATEGAAELPASAQALLYGKEQHIYDPKIGAPWSLASTPEECFTVTGVEMTPLLQMLDPSFVYPAEEYIVGLGGHNHYMSVTAIYPHGQYVHWGG